MEKTDKNKHLRYISSYSKIFIETMFYIGIVFLPRFIPLHLPNHDKLTIIITLALTSSILVEVLFDVFENNQKRYNLVLSAQLVFNVLLLAAFLHYFDRINGPFFLIYGLTLMESSLNLNIKVAVVVVGLMVITTLGEWLWLLSTGSLSLTFIEAAMLAIRLIYLVFMASYSRALAKTIISERELRAEATKLSQKLQRANLHLKDLDEMKDEFISVTSHELRTPLTSIRSYIWMALMGKGGQLTEKQKFYLSRSYNSTVRLIKLVNDILNISRIDSGRMNFTMEKTDIVRLTEEIVNESQARADELGVAIELNKEPIDLGHSPLSHATVTVNPAAGQPLFLPHVPEVIADKDKIREVLINLIGNALKFTPRGGCVKVFFHIDYDYVVTSVQDNGEGIEKEDLAKLFQKFGMVKGSYVTNQKASQGTGLGLFISSQLIKLHEGKIWAQSAGRGKGTTFSFSLRIFDQYICDRINTLRKGVEGMGIIHSEI